MFRRLRLNNFKRFQELDIPLKSINIIVGPNNSGKSSILAAFRMILQTLDSYDEEVPLLLNGPMGDFGTFKDIVYKNHRGRPLGLGFDLDFGRISRRIAEYGANSFDISYKYKSTERALFAEKIEIKNAITPLTTLSYSQETHRHNVESLGHTQIPSSLKSIISKEFRVRHFLLQSYYPRLSYLASRPGSSASTLSQFVQTFDESPDSQIFRQLNDLNRSVMNFVHSSDYLGPLRTPPQRTYLFSGERRSRIGSSGEFFAEMLMTRNSRNYDNLEVLNSTNSWLNQAEMAREIKLEPISDRHYELRIKNYFTDEEQNIADVGYGHSQVIPLLVGGYSLAEGSTYLVEQPELHLHPKAQSELGDFFTHLHMKDIQTIIETHSEHLILRLQQHVAAGTIKSSDINIIYVHNSRESDTGEISQAINEVKIIGIDNLGSFTEKWPKGFFPERLDESKKLAQIRAKQMNFKF